jgi:DUF1009 family protein
MNEATVAPLPSDHIGLIAGNGQFPREFMENARSRGISVSVVAIRGEADTTLQSLALNWETVGIGQLNKMLRALKRFGVSQAAFAGGVTRVRFLDGIRIDWRSVRMLAGLRSFNDDALLRAIIREVEKEGISVISATVLLEESVPKPGVLTRRALTPGEAENAQQGWTVARTVGGLDIGQSVILRNKTVIAVEAVEGTDATIRRAGEMQGDGGVLVKLAKPMQDLRIDLPTVGVKTIEEMAKSRLTALVVEAGRSIILKPQEVIESANRSGICIHSVANIEEIVSP